MINQNQIGYKEQIAFHAMWVLTLIFFILSLVGQMTSLIYVSYVFIIVPIYIISMLGWENRLTQTSSAIKYLSFNNIIHTIRHHYQAAIKLIADVNQMLFKCQSSIIIIKYERHPFNNLKLILTTQQFSSDLV